MLVQLFLSPLYPALLPRISRNSLKLQKITKINKNYKITKRKEKVAKKNCFWSESNKFTLYRNLLFCWLWKFLLSWKIERKSITVFKNMWFPANNFIDALLNQCQTWMTFKNQKLLNNWQSTVQNRQTHSFPSIFSFSNKTSPAKSDCHSSDRIHYYFIFSL